MTTIKPTLTWAVLPILLVLAMTSLAQAQRRVNEGLRRQWSVYEYPDPHSLNQDQQNLCSRPNVSSVCDPNKIISRTDADAIDNRINEVYTSTVCPCSACAANNRGYIIRVALMPRFERLFPETDGSPEGVLRDAQMYAYMLSEKWRMHGNCNETVLIMFSRDDHVVYTLTRRTSRVVLTDDRIAQITFQVRHYFDDNNTIADGLIEMIRQFQMVFIEASNRSR